MPGAFGPRKPPGAFAQDEDPYRLNEVPVDRGFLAPLATYADGKTEYALPGFPFGMIWDGLRSFGAKGFDTPEANEHNTKAALDAAGGAMTGSLAYGLAGGMVDNALGSAGGKLAAERSTPQGIRAYHGTRADIDGGLMPSKWGNNGPGLYVGLGESGLPIAETYAGAATFGRRQSGTPYEGGSVLPLNTTANLAPHEEYMKAWNVAARERGSKTPVEDAQEMLRQMGYDGITEGDQAVIFNPGTVFSATTGKQLYANAPTGAAVPLAGEAQDQDPFSYFRRQGD